MSVTNWQDPGSTEILSTHVSGLQEAIGKIEDAVGMQTTAQSGITLSEVYISDLDRYRIYQAPVIKRNWVSSPAPVIKKNGSIITTGFTIDYGGGAIIVNPAALSTDVFTADVTYTVSNPTLLAHITNTSNPHSVTAAQAGAPTTTDFNAHTANTTTAHGATAAATASTIVLRDASANIAANALTSSVVTGTAPLTVASTTAVANLNADMVDSAHAGNASGNVPLSNGTVNTNLNADMVDSAHAGNASGNVPLSNGTVNTNLNADMVDGAHVTGSAAAGLRGITLSTVAPSGGVDGDVWLTYA